MKLEIHFNLTSNFFFCNLATRRIISRLLTEQLGCIWEREWSYPGLP
jgi:hypothetical protein